MNNDVSQISWAPRVPKRKVRKLYVSEAEGMLDEDLLDDVGIALYLRCQSILTVGRAQKGQVQCPRCEKAGRDTVVVRESSGKEAVLTCPWCSWSVTWGEYHKTYRGKQLSEGGVGAYLSAFVNRYENAGTPRQKMLAIDRVIHEFHYHILKHINQPTRAAGVNLIEGKLTDVVAFLNGLTYDGHIDKRIVRTRESWRSTLNSIKWHPKG